MVKNIAAVILSFLLCVSLIGIIICMCANSTWLNSEFALDTLGNYNYYNAAYDAILSDYESIGIPSGIPVEIFDNALSRDMINQDIRKGIDCLYTNQTFSTDTALLKSNLKTAFTEYAKSINADIHDSSVKEALEELADYCASQYAEHIEIPFMKELSPYVSKAAVLAGTALILCITICAVCVIALIFIQKINASQYVGSSLIGSGLIGLTSCAVLLGNAPYKRLNLTIEVFYKFIIDLIESGLRLILTSSVAMVVLGIIVGTIYIYVMPAVFSQVGGHKRRQVE